MHSSKKKAVARHAAGWAVGLCGGAMAVAVAGAELPVPPPSLPVRLHGTRAVDRAAAERVLGASMPPESLTVRLGRLSAEYAARGFLAPRFTTTTGVDTLTVQVDEGPPAKLAAVYLRGMRVLPELVVREVLGLRAGGAFRPGDVENRLDGLVNEYARRGYLDAEAILERFETGPAGVVIGIAIAEGEPTQLAEVTVVGNSASRAEFVERLSGLVRGRPANLRRIREAPALLRRSGLFADVEDARVYRVQGADIGVVLRVVENPRRNTAFGAVGVARDPLRDTPYVTGSIDLAMRNLVGSGRDLDFAWRRDRLTGSRLAVAYRERFLLGGPVDATVRVSQTLRDSTSTGQTVELSGELPVHRSLALEGGGSVDRSVVHLGVTGNTLRWRAHVGLRWESLGREVDGGRFGTFEVRAETARRHNDLRAGPVHDESHVGQTIWGGRFDCGAPVRRRHTLAAHGEWHVLVSDESEVPANELFEFGGARTLRGYREQQFRGDAVAFGGLEYRYGDPRSAQVYVFCDAGAVRRRRADAPRESATHVGSGAGLRAAVATGAMDVSFGMGEERSFAAIKVHVSFVQRF